MKIVSFLLFFSLINSCHSQNESDLITITYEAITRGSSIEIKASSELIIYKDIETEKSFKPTSEDWEILRNLIEGINLSEMKLFIPPSDKRTVDAALHATLSITVNNATYKSQTFDHGNPPTELKIFVEKLLQIALK